MTDLPEFVMERDFDAPRALVWQAWTDPLHVARWYGPGVPCVVHKMDVTPGGLWLHEMQMPQGSGFQRMEYTEVEPPSRLVLLMSMADESWNVAPNPMQPDWPRTLRTTVTFEDNGTGTRMRLLWVPEGATEAEIAMFRSALAGLDKGWGRGMDVLADILVELQAA